MSCKTDFFIDLIESCEGIRCYGHVNVNKTHARKYMGVNGVMTIIDITEDEIPQDIAILQLKSLGLNYLIESLFPDYNGIDIF